MNRREFNLGVLLTTGLMFVAKSVAFSGPTKPLTPKDCVEDARRKIRLFELSQQQVRKCKMLYVLDDGEAYEMPPFASVIQDRTIGKITFVCEELKVTHTITVIGIRFVDDEGFEITRGISKFSYSIPMVSGDLLKCNYSVNLNQ